MRSVLMGLAVVLPLTAAAQEAARPVVSEIVTADPTRQRAFPGTVQADVEVALAFQTVGRLATLDVETGDRVERGQVLATLDQVTLGENVAAARAALEAVQAQAELAQQGLDRAQTLFERNVATAAQLEEAQASRDATAAQVEAARADLAQAEEVARFGSLVAPQDGVVLSTEAEVGTLVSAGTPVLTLADPRGREAVIDVPAEFVDVLSRGAAFEVALPSDTASPVPARLRLVEPVVGPSLRSRRLRLSMEDPSPGFRIGSLVTATYVSEGTPLMTLPRSALTDAPGGFGVWRVAPEDRSVHLVPVRLGAEVGDRVAVTGGIEVGDEVVTRGARTLSDGQVVGERVRERLE